MLFMLMFLGLLPAGLAYAGSAGDEGHGGGEGGDAGGAGADEPTEGDPAASAGEGEAPADLLDLMGPLASHGSDPAAEGAGSGAASGAEAESEGADSGQSGAEQTNAEQTGEVLPDAPDDDALADYGVDELDEGGQLVRLGAGSGDVSIADFRPGLDRVEVHLAPGEARFEALTDPESGAPGLRISGEDDDRQILFPGLDRLPVEDMLFTRGEGELLAGYRLQEMPDSEPLFPLPGDGVETVTPADAGDDPGAALHPLDPAGEETLIPGNGAPGLEPLPGDAEEEVTPAASGLGLVDEPGPEAPEGGAVPQPPSDDTPPRAAA